MSQALLQGCAVCFFQPFLFFLEDMREVMTQLVIAEGIMPFLPQLLLFSRKWLYTKRQQPKFFAKNSRCDLFGYALYLYPLMRRMIYPPNTCSYYTMQIISEMALSCSFVFFFCLGPLSKNAVSLAHRQAGFREGRG